MRQQDSVRRTWNVGVPFVIDGHEQESDGVYREKAGDEANAVRGCLHHVEQVGRPYGGFVCLPGSRQGRRRRAPRLEWHRR